MSGLRSRALPCTRPAKCPAANVSATAPFPAAVAGKRLDSYAGALQVQLAEHLVAQHRLGCCGRRRLRHQER